MYGVNLLSRTAGGNTMDYLYNGHADVTALMSSTGTLYGSYYYDAFGTITEQTGTANNSINYAGYQYDPESKTYYLNARMYDPTTARFLQEDTYTGDPNDPLSLNLYTYCHNEPIMYTDPTGHLYQGQTIQSGSEGADVIELQKRLEALGYLTMPTDKNGNKVAYGYFGDITLKAVNAYKTAKGLQNDTTATAGKVGATTWGFLGLKLQQGTSNDTSVVYQDSNHGKSNSVVSENPKLGFVTTPQFKPLLNNQPVETPIQPPAIVPAPPIPGWLKIGGSIAAGLTTFWNNQINAGLQDEDLACVQEQISKIQNDPKIKLDRDDKGNIIIYRLGNANLNTITPTPGKDDIMSDDRKIGMSWTLNKPINGKYVQSTIQSINSTGGLIAVPDGSYPGDAHVSVRPRFDDKNWSKLKNWTATKVYVNSQSELYDVSKAHTYTRDLQIVTVDMNGLPIKNK